VGVGLGSAQPSRARLSAVAVSNDVYVDFAIAAPIVEGLDVRFLELNSTFVKWDIELRPPGGMPEGAPPDSLRYLFARAIRGATFEVFVRPSAAPGTCETTRQLNGQWLEPPQVVDCAAAYTALSSFHLPVFTLSGVRAGAYDITLRATVTSGRSTKVKTPIVARAKIDHLDRLTK
jgi:hypothetical protein